MASNSSNLTTLFWFEFIEKVEYLYHPDFRYWLYLIVRPLVVTLGLVGNTLSFLVLRRKALRVKSFTVYLLALAVCDTGALLARLLMWINVLRAKLQLPTLVVFDSASKCVAVEYVFTCVHVLCGWLIVAVAGERALVLTCPLKAKIVATPSSAKLMVTVITLGTFTLFSFIPALTMYHPDLGCVMTIEWKYFHYYISTMFVTGLPFILISSANAWIVFQLHRAKAFLSSDTRKHNSASSDQRVSLMLLTVTFTFFVLLVPNALFVLISAVLPGWNPPVIIADLANLSFDLNYAINFYLYVFTGKHIRDEFKTMLKRGNRP